VPICTIYRRKDQEIRKLQAIANVKYFAEPLRVYHYKNHMRVAHPERLAVCFRLAGDSQYQFFSVSVPFVNTLTAHFVME
jgi:hypothetical protein